MTGRILQIILWAVVFICSTPAGMAKEYIPEEVRADFFVAGESLSADDEGKGLQEAALSLNDEAALFEAEQTSTTSFQNNGKEQKRHQKRQQRHESPKACFKTLADNSLSFNFIEKGYPRNLNTQDARRQETEMIRFLQLESQIC